MSDPWAPLAERFVATHYGSLPGRVRTHVIDRQLRDHLAPPPASVADVGGGAGNQSIPLARRGYHVTIVDSSPAMLARAEAAIAGEDEATRSRLQLVAGLGEELQGRFDSVLCHGVLMYLEDPAAMVAALCRAVAPGGIVSIVAKNRAALAVRPAAEGRWLDALAAFDACAEVNRLGLPTRADSVAELSQTLEQHGVAPLRWYGVRLFTDNRPDDAPQPDDEEAVFAVEVEAARRDPYRQLSRLFHLVARKR